MATEILRAVLSSIRNRQRQKSRGVRYRRPHISRRPSPWTEPVWNRVGMRRFGLRKGYIVRDEARARRIRFAMENRDWLVAALRPTFPVFRARRLRNGDGHATSNPSWIRRERWESDRERFGFKIDYLIRDWDWRRVKFAWYSFRIGVKEDLGFVRTIEYLMDEIWRLDRERFRFKIDYLIRDWDNDWKFGWDIRFKKDLEFVRTIEYLMDEMWGSDRERFRFNIDYLIPDWDNDWRRVKFGWDICFELV